MLETWFSKERLLSLYYFICANIRIKSRIKWSKLSLKFFHLEFLHSFVDSFNLRPDKVRVGLAQYSDMPHKEFLLGDYSDKTDLHQKLTDLIYRGGSTNTGLALTFIRENYFTLARQNVPGIAIVITDGESNDDVEEPSQRLRNLGVSIFVIRVGTGNMEKLRTIANIPHEEFLFSIDSYQELQVLKESLRNKVCFTVTFSENVKEEFLLNTDKTKNEILSSIRSLTLRPTGNRRIGNAIEYAHKNVFSNVTGSRVSEGFKQFLLVISQTTKADIYFLLDESGSINSNEFDDMKNFTKQLLEAFEVGNNHVRFGLVKFASSATIVFRIHYYNTKADIEKAVTSLRNMGGGTRTDLGLREMIPLFEEAVRTRGEKVRKLLIVITDGESIGTVESVEVPAKLLRTEQNVIIYAIGVKDASEPELELISGSPQRTFYVKNYDFLDEIKKDIITEICGCEGLFADVVFLLDGSESVSAKDFENMKDIMKLVIDRFVIGPDKERVAVVQYGTDPNEEFSLNTFDDKAVLLQKIGNIKQMKGKAYTGKALKEVLQSFDISKGGRCSAFRFLIVLTDGESIDDVAEPAKVLRDNFININAIGMRHADRSQIFAIAGSHDGSHDGVFFEGTFASPKDLSNDVLLKICNSGTDERQDDPTHGKIFRTVFKRDCK
uniref:VWFA domain-containing protein n=1 Tax=Sinocyclocheilus anshuiensis TaxID=1608454 RepID=A0A671KY16_9TELE